MLTINFLFILRKSVNLSVVLFANRKMNSTTDLQSAVMLLQCPSDCLTMALVYPVSRSYC